MVSFPGGCLPEESPALLSEPNSPRLCNAKSGGVGFNSFQDFASNYNIFLNFTSNCNTFLDFASNSNFNIFLNFASNCNTFLDFASNFNIFEFASYCNPQRIQLQSQRILFCDTICSISSNKNAGLLYCCNLFKVQICENSKRGRFEA